MSESLYSISVCLVGLSIPQKIVTMDLENPVAVISILGPKVVPQSQVRPILIFLFLPKIRKTKNVSAIIKTKLNKISGIEIDANPSCKLRLLIPEENAGSIDLKILRLPATLAKIEVTGPAKNPITKVSVASMAMAS